MPQASGSQVRDSMRRTHLILLAALGLGVHSASNRNEYQKQRKMFLLIKARPRRKFENITVIYTYETIF
jgi:hypothetical protein